MFPRDDGEAGISVAVLLIIPLLLPLTLAVATFIYDLREKRHASLQVVEVAAQKLTEAEVRFSNPLDIFDAEESSTVTSATAGRTKTVTREVTITISGEGKLGLVFKKGRVPLEVTQINPQGLAARVDQDGDQIQVGMTLVRVNKTPVPVINSDGSTDAYGKLTKAIMIFAQVYA